MSAATQAQVVFIEDDAPLREAVVQGLELEGLSVEVTGAAGAIAYVLLLLLGMRATGQPAPVRAPGAPPVTEEAGRANVLY